MARHIVTHRRARCGRGLRPLLRLRAPAAAAVPLAVWGEAGRQQCSNSEGRGALSFPVWPAAAPFLPSIMGMGPKGRGAAAAQAWVRRSAAQGAEAHTGTAVHGASAAASGLVLARGLQILSPRKVYMQHAHTICHGRKRGGALAASRGPDEAAAARPLKCTPSREGRENVGFRTGAGQTNTEMTASAQAPKAGEPWAACRRAPRKRAGGADKAKAQSSSESRQAGRQTRGRR